MLILVGLILSSLFIPLFNLSSFLIVIISYFILFPIERLIGNKYKKKAKEKLSRIEPLIIGITGSYGKTTFKNVLFDVLQSKFNVLKTPGNVNTPMGIIKFINQELTTNTEVLILELGIDQINGMDKFKDIINLDIGVITSIGENHLANFKSIKNTFKAKMKIQKLLKKNAKLFLNNDDELLKTVKSDDLILFSKSNVKENKIDINGLIFEYNNQEILVPLYGTYLYSYLDGVVKIGEFLGLNADDITYGIKQIKKISRRMEVRKFKKGYFINDSYNINLKGVKESIDLLKTLDGNSVVVLGGMIEQGKDFVKSNNQIKELLKNQNVIFLGSAPHPLISNHQYKNLFILNSLKDAYKLIERLDFTNILLLAKSDDIFLR